MTDTVLQSFCERCGTRYTFTEQEHKPEGGLSVLGRLVKRGPDAAPGEPTVSTTLPSSDRFEGTFHFCLECRQYTCGNCWNTTAGYCIGCRPPGQVVDAPVPGPTPRATSKPAPPRRTPTAGSASLDSGRSGSSTADPWSSGDSVAAAILGASVGSDSAARSTSSAQDARKDLPWSKPPTEADTVLDEWGRPVRRTTPIGSGASTDRESVETTQPQLDPWRGVVFSSGEPGKVETPDQVDERSRTSPSARAMPSAAPKPPPSEWPATDQRRTTPPDRAADAPAWPDSDARPRPSNQPAQQTRSRETPWPDEARAKGEPDAAERPAITDDHPRPPAGPAERPAHPGRKVAAVAVAGAIAGSGPSTEPDAPPQEAPDEEMAESPAAEPGDVSMRFVEPSDVDSDAPAEPSDVDADAPAVPVVEIDASADATTSEPEAAGASTAEVGATSAEPAVEGAPADGVATDQEADVPADAPGMTQVDSRATAEEAASAEDARSTAAAPQAEAGPTPQIPAVDDEATLEAVLPPTGASGAIDAAAIDSTPVAPEPEPTSATSTPPPRTMPAVLVRETPAPALPVAPSPPLAPLPTPPTLKPWGSDVASGPFSQPYAAAGPIHVPPPPSPGRSQPPQAPPPDAAPPPPRRQVPMPSQAAPPGPSTVPHPGLVAPPPATAAPLPTRGERASTRACTNCALPLSAKARFCRRCGSPQA